MKASILYKMQFRNFTMLIKADDLMTAYNKFLKYLLDNEVHATIKDISYIDFEFMYE